MRSKMFLPEITDEFVVLLTSIETHSTKKDKSPCPSLGVSVWTVALPRRKVDLEGKLQKISFPEI